MGYKIKTRDGKMVPACAFVEAVLDPEKAAGEIKAEPTTEPLAKLTTTLAEEERRKILAAVEEFAKKVG